MVIPSIFRAVSFGAIGMYGCCFISSVDGLGSIPASTSSTSGCWVGKLGGYKAVLPAGTLIIQSCRVFIPKRKDTGRASLFTDVFIRASWTRRPPNMSFHPVIGDVCFLVSHLLDAICIVVPGSGCRAVPTCWLSGSSQSSTLPTHPYLMILCVRHTIYR